MRRQLKPAAEHSARTAGAGHVAGCPDGGGFEVQWRDHAHSRQALGYGETARQLERRLLRCHPTNRSSVAKELDAARAGQGPTVFDWLVTIFEDEAPGVLKPR